MVHADASAEGDLALGLDSVELGKNAAGVRGECGQHFTVIGQCDEAHVVLRVAAGLRVTDYVDSVLLSLQPGG